MKGVSAMRDILEVSGREKLEEMIGSLSLRFDFPLVLMDMEGEALASAGTPCAGLDCLDGVCCPAGTLLADMPVRHRGERLGTLAACIPVGEPAKELEAAAYCLEQFFNLETEIDDLSSEVVRVYDELSIIYSLSNKLGSEMDVDTICRRVLEEAERILSVHNLSIMLLDAISNELYTRMSTGRDRETAYSFRCSAGTGFIEHICRQGEPVTVCDIAADGRFSLPFPATSVLCVPLLSDKRMIGMLLACDKLSGEEFWSQELKLMGVFAAEVASAIKKAQLYEEINEIFINTVQALASAIDAKDPYTYGHSRRVARLSAAICEELGMLRKDIRQVVLAAILHDIGKIGTPERILQKPGHLEPAELEKIKEHPARGAQILSNIREFNNIIKWIRHHHEWYDGKGYPDHMSAENIPLEARVITIADAFDAMTSDRPYRKGMPANEALRIMNEFAGSQFDPRILTLFKQVYDSGRERALFEGKETGDGLTGRQGTDLY
jgi:putative nucleotidyltransferase with HDIG domain